MRRAAEVAGPSRSRTVNRPVLVSNLLAGGALAGGSALLVSWPLSLVAAVYVAVASAFFGVVYARRSLSRRQEVSVWVAPWLLAVALWTGVVAVGEDGSTSSPMLNVWAGSVIGTGCYLVWQTIALAVRQLISADSRSDNFPS